MEIKTTIDIFFASTFALLEKYHYLCTNITNEPTLMAQFNIQAYKAVGGVFSKGTLRTLPLILLMALLFVSCEKELFHYAEITEYHAESQQLDVATTDSIARFSSKVQGFVAQHPDAKDDPLYPEILNNINIAKLNITIIIHDEWDGETHIKY